MVASMNLNISNSVITKKFQIDYSVSYENKHNKIYQIQSKLLLLDLDARYAIATINSISLY